MSDRQNATGWSSSEIVDNPDSIVHKEFKFPMSDPIEGPHATVNVALGLTVNLGNYESARIDVGVRMPCAATEEACEEAYQNSLKWCESRIQTEVREMRGRNRG